MEEWIGKIHHFNNQRMEEVNGKMQHKCHLMVELVQSILHPLRMEEWTVKMHQFHIIEWRR